MADTSQYPDSAGKGNTHNDFGMDDGFMAESLDRVLRYGIPFRIYAEAFQREGGDPNPMDTSCILDALVAAAIWGAANGRDVLTTRQVEQSEQQECDFDEGAE